MKVIPPKTVWRSLLSLFLTCIVTSLPALAQGEKLAAAEAAITARIAQSGADVGSFQDAGWKLRMGLAG